MPKREMMRVTIRGITYENAKAAAEALGVHKSTVYSAICRGVPDTIGLRRGTRPKESCKSGKGRPFTIGGVTFASIAQASEALGFRRNYLATALLKGKAVTRHRIAQAAMRWTARQEMAAMRAQSKQAET